MSNEINRIHKQILELSNLYSLKEPADRTSNEIAAYFFTDLCSKYEHPDEELKMIIEHQIEQCDFRSEFAIREKVIFNQLRNVFVEQMNLYYAQKDTTIQ